MTSRAARRLLAVSLVALAVAGCTSRGGSTGTGMAVPALGTPASVAAAVQHWGERFNRNPADEQAAFAYSRALLAQDQRTQAVAVLRRAVLANRDNRFLQGELGKALAANGQFDEALNVFAQAHTPDRPDWRVLSAQGAVLDQLGRTDEARRTYETALRIAPGEPAVLSNLGLSHALNGDLPTAERHLAQAMAHPRATPQVRQNLALVIALQGRFPEAEALARRDLPPDQAERNVAMIRSMLQERSARGGNRNAAPAATPAATAAAPQPRRGELAAPVLAEEARRAQAAGSTPAAATAGAPAATSAGAPANLIDTSTRRRERMSPDQARQLLGS